MQPLCDPAEVPAIALDPTELGQALLQADEGSLSRFSPFYKVLEFQNYHERSLR